MVLLKSSILFIFIVSYNSLKAGILDLKVTEIMYNPTDYEYKDSKELEFIELKNTGLDTLNLKSLFISGGINFSFNNDFFLAPDSFCLLVSNKELFIKRYPSIKVDGEYINYLKNSGEDLVFKSGLDKLFEIEYDDNIPWSPLADGNGFSLVSSHLSPTKDQNNPSQWKNSCFLNGSPRKDDPNCSSTNYDLWINEILSHTDLPMLDAIEIFNNSNNPVDISNWFLSDSRSNPNMYIIPEGTMISPNDFFVIDESSFNPEGKGFRFNRSGDNVYLFSANEKGALTGFATGWEFDAQYNSISFGVYLDSKGEKHLVSQTESTFGYENSPPQIGPLVITELMYNPKDDQPEYLVIKNISDSLVNLWHYGTPDSGWSVSGLNFNFPSGVSLNPAELVILTNDDTTRFRKNYGLNNSIKIFQCFGKLSNSGESISLWSYDRMDTTDDNSIFMPKVLMDRVAYETSDPWSSLANGHGYALERIDNYSFGNNASNWRHVKYLSLKNQKINKNKIRVSYSSSYIKVQGESSSYTLKLFDTIGKILLNVRVNQNELLSITDLPSGQYICNITSRKDFKSLKIIK